MKKKMFFGASNLIFEKEKELRKNLTFSETLLWGYLKQSPQGYKFRRQHPVGIYIVDFYCHALQLVIEVDGSIHDLNETKQNDLYRQSILENDGLTILRFRNEEINTHLQDVISQIETFIINSKNKKPL